MKYVKTLWLLGLIMLPLSSFAQEWQTEGERLTYKVKYSFISAGFAEIAFNPHTSQNKYDVVGRAWTHEGLSSLIQLRDRLSIEGELNGTLKKLPFESKTYTAKLHENDYNANKKTEFDHRLNQAVYRNIKDGSPARIRKFPEGSRDIFSALYHLRSQAKDVKIGDTFTLPVVDMTKDYTMHLKVIGREKIKTPWGKKYAFKIQPILERLSDKRKDDDLFLWVTDDENLIPVRIQIKMKIGSFNAYLKSAGTYASKSRAPEYLPEQGEIPKPKGIRHVNQFN